MANNDICRPIPAPRRLYPELHKKPYENVTVDLINKNLNNNSNCKEKIPNNKVFLVYPKHQEDMDKMQHATNKMILTETNDLYGPNANKMVPMHTHTTPTPTPRSRKPRNSEKYENVIITPLESQEAVRGEVMRPAPKVPSKKSPKYEMERETRARSYSTTSETSTASANSSYNTNSVDGVQWRENSLNDNKSTASSIKKANLESSITSLTESSESTDSTKYKSPSPGDLLKSLSTTSKLLTESIGERMAFKAKDAKQKFDKNLKNSSDLLSNIGSETTQRLKKLSSNFTLTKRDKTKETVTATELDLDRPQTVPANGEVFNKITFSSPLTHKTEARYNLNTEDDLNSSYEIPRSLKPVKKESEDFMDSEKAVKETHTKQNNIMTLNTYSEELKMESSDNTSTDSVDLPSPPMPTTPAPILFNITKSENHYGKLNRRQPPARQKRRGSYENIQLRKNSSISRSSLKEDSIRVNVDSTELKRLNADIEAAEHEESFILRQRIEAEEKCTSMPERSNSWEYHEEGSSKSDLESSSSESEPIYANQEKTYSNVFEMATSNRDLLTPQNMLISIVEEESDDSSDLGAIGGQEETSLPQDIIQEFDPLLIKREATICQSDKSNQLLLLEYLLEQETYGTLKKKHSTIKALEEDNTKTFKEEASKEKTLNHIQIVHQNAQLHSDSKQSILTSVDKVKNQDEPFLMRVENEDSISLEPPDLSKPSQNRSQWFVNDNKTGDLGEKLSNSLQNVQVDDSESPPSYLEAISEKSPASESKVRVFSFKNTKNVLSNVKSRVDALKRKTSFKLSQKTTDVKITLQMVPRPSLSPLLIRYEGPLIRFPSGMVEDILKEMQNRKAVLRERQFQTFLDHEMKTLKEAIPLENITTIQCISNSRITDNATQFYCFELTTATPKISNNSTNGIQYMSNPNLIMTSGTSGNVKQQRACHLYGVSKESERGIWMQKLLESLTNAIPSKYMCQYYRAGWSYLKYSITSDWSGCWLVLKKSQRRLIFVSEAKGNIEKVDLRKARCIVLKESDETIKNLHVESGPVLMIDAPPFTLYLIMSSPRETKIWRHIIREVAHNNGFTLAEQQLTKFNVPVIVDKCINFIYIHGSMSEGIYRKSGSENSIHTLMSAFRADAFSVEITRNEYNEHDVANVLKRFMRDLPERLMGKLSDSFVCIAALHSTSEKIHLYRELLARLNVVEHETLKKILGHLAFISSQKAKNKMTIQNLTMIWGPTLVQCNHHEEMIYSQKEADVITDLINHYKDLFPLSADEAKKEQEMLKCLQKYYAAAETLTDTVKKSGDLKIWITLNSNPDNTREEKTQVNVTVSPTKTAYEVCKELASKMHLATHQVSLHEIILNGNLERPLHYDTKVFDVILNWSYWPDDDRKNNSLMVKPIDLLNDVQRAVKNSVTITPGKELKFADKCSKTYKQYQCDLRDGKIVISKKEKNEKSTIVKEIFLHGSTVYLGCEKKREFPWSWAITFVEGPHSQILRSRDSPFIGHVLAGSEWADRTLWYSSIWYCLYGDSILPPAEIIIK